MRPNTWKLDFAESRKAAQRALGRQMEILHPMVTTGHALLRDCAEISRDTTDVAVAASFRQCLEFVDAVDILLRHLAIVPAMAQARSSVETAAYTLYLVRERNAVVSSAFLYSGIRHAENEFERKRNLSHLDDDDRRAMHERTDEFHAFYAAHATDYASRTAIDALRKLRSGSPWYSIQSGPRNLRELLKRADAADLAQVYSDLNSTVHEGMPQVGFHGANGEPFDPEGGWIRPLRVPSPWAFRPLLIAGSAAKISLVVALAYFIGRLPSWQTRIDTFAAKHNQRCRACGFEALTV